MRWAYGERRACMAASIWELSVPPLSLIEEGVVEKVFSPKEVKTKTHGEQLLAL